MQGEDEKSEASVSAAKTMSLQARASGGHKRSKSASDKTPDFGRHGNANYFRNDNNEIKKKERSHACQASTQLDPRGSFNDSSLNNRSSLENDIKHLQLHLYQEKSIRQMLERAIGRASSTLSPGHRHFTSQTKDLIAEIELLEEEIADREQHVLSLYRSVFDQCVSTATSTQSSGKSSPAHVKSETRKHPSIISSSFCSSRKFPLQHFQILGSIKESGKSYLSDKSKARHELPLRGSKHGYDINNLQASSKYANVERSYFARTLKDHLYQCPSKLSEELIRCMAAIYYWLRCDGSTKSDKACSPFLSRSSTSTVIPRRGTGDNMAFSCKSTTEISSISMSRNQFSSASYAVNNYRLRGNKLGKYLLQQLHQQKFHHIFFSCVTPLFKNTTLPLIIFGLEAATLAWLLVEQLERVDMSVMENNAKLAFWINVYNSLVMHVYLVYGTSHSTLRRMTLFHKAAYKIGGITITANSIEYSILCHRTHRIGRWYETILSTAMRKKTGESKQLLESKIGLSTPQPLVLFGLCTGASSDPMLRVYSAKNVMEELQKAKKEFLQTNIVVGKSRKVLLPKILDRYAREASLSMEDLLNWIYEDVDKKTREAIQKCIDSKGKKKMAQVIEWSQYNTKFCYVLGEELTEKHWCA